MKKFTYDFVRNAFDEYGYDLISTEYQNANAKLQYICRKHKDKGVQLLSFGYLRKHHSGCRYCGDEIRQSKIYERIKADILDICDKNNFKYIRDELVGTNREIYFVCNNHPDKGIQHMQLTHLRNRNIIGCNYCNGYYMKTTEDFKNVLKINKPDIVLLNEYTGTHNKVACKCKICGHEWNVRADKILYETGCPQCSIESHRNQMRKSESQFKEEFNIKFPHLELLSSYTFMYNDVLVRCKQCGEVGAVKPAYLFIHGYKCKKCGKGLSYTEDIIRKLLSKWGIDYTTQKRFDDCKDKMTLPFDFYLYNDNACVEYDGEHHYYPVDFGYMTQEEAEDQLKLTQYHDCIKNEYCKANNIKLIRIPYWKHDDLEYELFDQLTKNKIIKEYQ